MLNDRNDKYEGSDNSEYHFSDDEENYEPDAGSTKQSSSGNPLAGSANRSKRIIISGVVFVALILVVYKMIAPTTSEPTTIITPQASTQMMSAQPASPVVPVVSAQSAPTSQAPISQMPPQVSPVVQQNTGMGQQSVAEMPGQSPTAPPPQPAVAQYNNNVMPAVMPATPQYNEPDTSLMGSSQAPSMIIEPGSSGYDDKAAALAAENAKLTEQLQAEYNKRINEYQNQNKILQEQVQSLSNKVATVENQMNQMIQALGPQAGNPPQSEALSALPERAAPPPHIPYTVQAIIPGRAWLRSSNGETLTVAEGDEVKGVGRVGKIDPYDGTVEINVQGRSVVLSYGNGN